jgi:hypothetical protein
MTTGPVSAERVARNTEHPLAVPLTMQTVRAAFPIIRALILATIVTLLIMVGLPQLLAAAAAAS